MHCRLAAGAALAATLLAHAAVAQPSLRDQGTHHIAVVVGGGDTRNEDRDTDDATLIGFEYDYRWSGTWSAGLRIDAIDVGNHTNTTVLVPLAFRPLEQLRLSFAPGVEFNRDDPLGLFRIAASYTLPLTDRWFVAPEAAVDFTDDNGAFLATVSIGYVF